MTSLGGERTPALSILIINWNGWLDIKKCLESIRISSFTDHEIIVIDNASTDGSVEKLRTHFPEINVYVNQFNVGHARAVNKGFGLIRGKYILLLDADTELAPETISKLMSFMAQNQDVSVAAPRTFNADGSIQESARNFPSFMSGLFGRQSLLSRVFPNNPFTKRYLLRDKLSASEPFQVEQVSAACMIFPRSLNDEAGPWDEKYFTYWVDTDWCMQLNKMGKKIFCVPEARIIHYEKNRSGRKKSPARIWNFHLGAFRLYRKHYTFGIFDPRSIMALIALSIRAGILMIGNSFLPADESSSSNKQSTLRPIFVRDDTSNVRKQDSGMSLDSDNMNEEKANKVNRNHVTTAYGHPEYRQYQVYAIEWKPEDMASRQSVPVAVAEAIYRAGEVILSLLALLLTLPIMILVAIIIRIDSPGPILFFHRRAAKSELLPGCELMDRKDLKAPAGGFDPNKLYYVPKDFYFPKFRTMYHDALQKYPEYYWWNYDLTREQLNNMFYKLEDDPRVTRVGKWLRKITIDELPNFWSVLTGDMRLVGPRPEIFELQHYYTEEQMIKFTVKPGITCLSKIYGRGNLSFQEQVHWDLEYVRTRSLRLDLKILVKTLMLIVRREGAF